MDAIIIRVIRLDLEDCLSISVLIQIQIQI